MPDTVTRISIEKRSGYWVAYAYPPGGHMSLAIGEGPTEFEALTMLELKLTADAKAHMAASALAIEKMRALTGEHAKVVVARAGIGESEEE